MRPTLRQLEYFVAVAERDGMVTNPDGLNITDLHAHMRATGGVKDFPGATFEPNSARALELDCDILIPAAMEAVIHVGNAGAIRARLIVEAANGPITAEADAILRARGVVIVPDLYANAGGVTVSYFEWVKNLGHISFGRMERRQEEARHRILDQAGDLGFHLGRGRAALRREAVEALAPILAPILALAARNPRGGHWHGIPSL